MPRIVIEKGPDKGRSVALTPKGTLLIGRDSSTNFQLRDTMSSRMHFKIEYREDSYWLCDLDSMNGTLHNGQPVREAKLNYGDLIKVGETLFSFLSDDVAATTLAGQRIGGYRIIERVGRGGMGTVYKAEQVDLQRIVALKVISEENSKDKEFVDLFIHEARAAGKLNHPNLVQVYDVKRHSDLHYFSMEFVAGGSVQDLLAKQRKCAVAQTLGWMLDAARGLDYAHKKGIVHRDIKPDNLMISEDGQIKIGDMGLARSLGEKIGPDEENCVIGTPHYIAPEQVLGKQADFRSDIYSLGATVYRMLAGATPFTAPSIRDLVNKKVREDPKPLHEADAEIPRRVSDMIQKMMSRDPMARYATMQEVLSEIEKIQRELAGLPADAKEATGRVPATNKKLLVAAVGLLAVVLVGGIVGAAFIMKKKPADKPVEPDKGDNEELAIQMLVAAKTGLDTNNLESIRQSIREYQRVIDKFPGTKYSEEAAGFKAGLEKTLREKLAEIKFGEVEGQDLQNYDRLKRTFQEGKLDLTIADATITLYNDFALAEDVKGTPAAEKATKRAAHILDWKQRVEKQQTLFRETLARAKAARDERKYKEAWTVLNTYTQDCSNAAIPCDFSRDRYKSLLFDIEANEEAKKILTRAKADYDQTEEECRKLCAKKTEEDYKKGLDLLNPIIRDSIDDLSIEAMTLRRQIEQEYAKWRAEKEKKEREAALALEKKDRESFAKASTDAHNKFVLYKFAEALGKLRDIRSGLSEAMLTRVDARIFELSCAVALKDGMKTVFKDGKFKKDFKWTKLNLAGKITGFSDTGFTVTLDPSGTYDFRFEQFDPPREFYAFVKSSWPKMDPHDQFNLAIVCLEFGLYEEALAELEAASKNPESARDPALAQNIAAYKKLVEASQYTEYEEIEAQKRLKRLNDFVKANDVEAARREVDILKREYSRTKIYEDNQKLIEDALQKILEKSTDDQKKKMKSSRAKLIEEAHQAALADARRRQPDIITRINGMNDTFEKNLHLGEMWAAHAEWGKSSERWIEAKKAGDRMTMNKDAGREFYPILGEIYVGIIRNAMLLKDKKTAEQVRQEGERKFVEDESRKTAEWWSASVKYIQFWAEKQLPKADRATVEKMIADVRDNPDDPKRLWQLAETYLIVLHNPLEARGYYQFLLENHPEFDSVRKGDCLHRLAEIHFKFREVREALALYRLMRDEHRDHDKVADDRDEDSVKRRIGECLTLMEKMGYPREKDPRDKRDKGKDND